MTDMYSISVNLRAVAHILHYADYIQNITDDADFFGALIEIVSDYLYLLAEDSGETFEITDKKSCEKSLEIKELKEQIKNLMSELSEFRPEEPEQEEEPEEVTGTNAEQVQEDE